jgi:S1-C subfamily serine protease
MNLRELVSEVRQSVYAVIIEWSNPMPGQIKIQVVGTAFAVSSEGHFVTANHVVNPHQNVPAGNALGPQDRILLAQMQPDGMTATISGPYVILASSQQHDYALLFMPTASGRVQNFLPVDMGSRFEGEDVAICGYPLASSTVNPINTNNVTLQLNLRVAAGIISSRRIDNNSKILEVDFPILPGNSGGPLFSKATGKVLGISSATMSVGGSNGLPSLGHIGIAKDIRNALVDFKAHVPFF